MAAGAWTLLHHVRKTQKGSGKTSIKKRILPFQENPLKFILLVVSFQQTFEGFAVPGLILPLMTRDTSGELHHTRQ